jgi:hypothetical protein
VLQIMQPDQHARRNPRTPDLAHLQRATLAFKEFPLDLLRELHQRTGADLTADRAAPETNDPAAGGTDWVWVAS